MPSVAPPVWDADRLEADRQLALANFVASWGERGSQRYVESVRELSAPLERLFSATRDLLDLRADAFITDASLLKAARFLTAPPVSADDLKTLIGGDVGVRRPNLEQAQKAVQIIRSAWDPIRFPWLAQNRSPTQDERATAIAWTASIWAIETLRTLQRNTSSKQQEDAVKYALASIRLEQVAPRRIENPEDLPRASFTGECRLANNKCDVPVRLADGRLLAIECKVSNSAVNSKKRLNDSGGAKANDWRATFGSRVISAVVLAGVYSLGNLMTAQDTQGMTIARPRTSGRLRAIGVLIQHNSAP